MLASAFTWAALLAMGQVGGGEVGCVTREADTAEDAQASGLECCVRADWRMLQYVDESVRADPKVVLAAVEIDWRAYELGAEALKADRAFLLAAMERDVRVYTVALRYRPVLDWRSTMVAMAFANEACKWKGSLQQACSWHLLS